MRIAGRDTLQLGDRPTYVEPVALAASGTQYLLAGSPNYIWPSSGQVMERSVARDSIFGVVLRGNGAADAVLAPIAPSLIFGIRASGRGDGTWDVVFAEAVEPWSDGSPRVVKRLWHGVLAHTSWRSIDSLKVPEGASPLAEFSSALHSSNDTLIWAMPTRMPGGRTDVLVLTQSGSASAARVVRTGAAAYAIPVDPSTPGLALVVVAPERRLPGRMPFQDKNSLLVYESTAETGRWRVSLLQRGGDSPVYAPSWVSAGTSGVLTWRQVIPGVASGRTAARARVGDLTSPLSTWPEFLLDSNSAQIESFVSSPHTPTWLSVHVDAKGVPSELWLLTGESGAPRLTDRIAVAFDGPIAVARDAMSGLLIAGPRRGRVPTGPVVMTLLVHSTILCDASRP